MPGFWNALLLSATCSAMLGLAAGLQLRSLDISKTASASEQLAEETALKHYQQAADLAEKAVAAFNSANSADSDTARLDLTLRERDLWRSALKKIAAVPTRSDLHERAIAKQAQYEKLLANAENKIAKANQDFILGIIQAANINPSGVHVTLCQIEAAQTAKAVEPEPTAQQKAAKKPEQKVETIAADPSPPVLLKKGKLDGHYCRQHQGDQLMASAASLIKVPIALALVHHTADHSDAAGAKPISVNLSQKIVIDPGNFTENAAGAIIEIGEEYTLQKVMSHMISDSDNIATNQLIDYLGYDNINQALSQLGYSRTSVGHKLAGDQVMPEGFGVGSNQTSTNEITAMMAQMYESNASGNKAIVTALGNQSDRELGYEALMANDRAAASTAASTAGLTADATASSTATNKAKIEWLGEKTAQNAQVLASTLIMQVGQERYVLTVALDNSGDAYAIRQIVSGIADHLAKVGPLVKR